MTSREFLPLEASLNQWWGRQKYINTHVLLPYHQDNSETTSIMSPEIPQKNFLQVPTTETCLTTHCLSASPLPTFLVRFPGITSQMDYMFWDPSLRLCLRRNPNRDDRFTPSRLYEWWAVFSVIRWLEDHLARGAFQVPCKSTRCHAARVKA